MPPNDNKSSVYSRYFRPVLITMLGATADTGFNYWSYMAAKQLQAGLTPVWPTSVQNVRVIYTHRT